MAITKFNNQKNSMSKSRKNKLSRAVRYIFDESKTSPDLIGGIGVDVKHALYQMKTVKEFYNKIGGREYIHFVVSVRETASDDMTMIAIANRIASFYEGFQILYAVHHNTKHSHIHFIMNSVNALDGHKFTQSKADLERFKEFVEKGVDPYRQIIGSVYVEDSNEEDDDYYYNYSNCYDDDDYNESESIYDDCDEDENREDCIWISSYTDSNSTTNGSQPWNKNMINNRKDPDLIEPVIFYKNLLDEK